MITSCLLSELAHGLEKVLSGRRRSGCGARCPGYCPCRSGGLNRVAAKSGNEIRSRLVLQVCSGSSFRCSIQGVPTERSSAWSGEIIGYLQGRMPGPHFQKTLQAIENVSSSLQPPSGQCEGGDARRPAATRRGKPDASGQARVRPREASPGRPERPGGWRHQVRREPGCHRYMVPAPVIRLPHSTLVPQQARCLSAPSSLQPVIGQAHQGFEPGQAPPAVTADQQPEAFRYTAIQPLQSRYRCLPTPDDPEPRVFHPGIGWHRPEHHRGEGPAEAMVAGNQMKHQMAGHGPTPADSGALSIRRTESSSWRPPSGYPLSRPARRRFPAAGGQGCRTWPAASPAA